MTVVICWHAWRIRRVLNKAPDRNTCFFQMKVLEHLTLSIILCTSCNPNHVFALPNPNHMDITTRSEEWRLKQSRKVKRIWKMLSGFWVCFMLCCETKTLCTFKSNHYMFSTGFDCFKVFIIVSHWRLLYGTFLQDGDLNHASHNTNRTIQNVLISPKLMIHIP